MNFEALASHNLSLNGHSQTTTGAEQRQTLHVSNFQTKEL